MVTASADELQAISRRLMEVGNVGLYKQLGVDIKAAVDPVKPAIRESALSMLPQQGGLNVWVAASRVSTTVLRGTYTAGVQVRVSLKGHDIRDLDSGSIRHPVFKQQAQKGTPWVAQQITPGFASKPLEALRGPVVAACMAAALKAAAQAGFV